jgi:hypothetical protein
MRNDKVVWFVNVGTKTILRRFSREPQLTPEQAEDFPKISQNLHVPTFIVLLVIKNNF